MKVLLGLFITVSLFGACLPNGDDDTNTTWELDAAVDPVFRLADRDQVSGILQAVNTGASYTVHWRARTVTNQRRTHQPEISAEREWLWRWDRAHPRDIFQNGFLPRVAIFRAMAVAGRTPSTNLRLHVANNIASVFVSTTRRDWAPRSRDNTFRYDIFAPGGIDVNPTLGPHNWENQMEIAFVGGIRTEYIYGAVEYGPSGNQIRSHINLLYRGSDTRTTRRNVCRLRVVYHNWFRDSQPTDYCEAIRPAREKRSTSTELMRSPGLTLKPLSDCSYWYKVNVQYLSFDQPDELGQIEPYGFMSVYIGNYKKSDVFRQSTGHDAPSVVKNENVFSKAKCLVVQSDTNSDTVQVCFDGNVDEYDSSSDPDQIANFSQKCNNTHPSTKPSILYRASAKGVYGSLKWAFKVSPCDESCLKKNLRDDTINGVC